MPVWSSIPDRRSGDIIEMMKKMKLDYEDQKTELEKAETEALNAYKLADAAKQQGQLPAAPRGKLLY